MSISASRSLSSCCSGTYSHLLYVDDLDRENILAGSSLPTPQPRIRRVSTSYFSMTSSRCSIESQRSTLSSDTAPSSHTSSFCNGKILTPRYADAHYPLVSTLIDVTQEPSPSTCSPGARLCARQLASIHNALIRAINSAYNHAPTIEPCSKRCADYLQFNQILYKILDQHLRILDSMLSPIFDRAHGSEKAAKIRQQSPQTFRDGFRTLRDYIYRKSTVCDFDAQHHRKIIESFAPDLIQYLHNEISAIVALPGTSCKQIRRTWSQVFKSIIDSCDMYVDCPFMLSCLDKTFKMDGKPEDFPRPPWVIETLVRTWYVKKHAAVWEFCPSDINGNRKLIHL